MDLSRFDYHLPECLIAQTPAADRSCSRLLYVAGPLQDMLFTQFIDLLNPGDLVVMNNTKVIPARLFGAKPTGGKVEIMLERITGEFTALAQLKSSKSIKPKQEIIVSDEIRLIVKDKNESFYELESKQEKFEDILSEHGQLPLPPYIKRIPDQADDSRYQTVYAKQSGAVAAPTAGLHFDHKMLKTIKKSGIEIQELTLHVGAGTFQPVRVDDVTKHKMHQEWFEIGENVIEKIKQTQNRGGRVIAIGTTTVRALESAFSINQLEKPLQAETDIFIYPGFEFKVVDALLTNFHLPKSTLLMLVSAFAGYDKVMQAYRHAVKSEYRFFSYGDAMFLEKGAQTYRNGLTDVD